MNYASISPTAATIAWLRAQEEVDYAKAIGFQIDLERVVTELYNTPDFDVDLARMRKMGPWAVLRLFALQKAVLSTGITNIIELASGLSPTGLLLSEDHPQLEYLEADLPDMHVLKSGIAAKILAGRERTNLRFMPVDVLRRQQLEAAVHSFSRAGSVCVANEGLLQYFTHDEKRKLAQSLRSCLPKGSAWITTDVVRKKDFSRAFSKSSYTERMRQVLADKTGRDMVACAFDSFEEAETLFTECGFVVYPRRQLDLVPKLFPAAVLDRHCNLEVQQVWELRPT